ncbi:membrane protein [Longispora fulva]|uniref:Putative membrane protein SpoIIM required for sporulation n=1 Tax=Longispora fulva TaxID=619741 RepID=A0A8J7GNI3_9ACTN|nr:stage II sporulation protein M [Longispora fulva]MBG6140392.1 putative membrane protein SpoIIM required for sporulation [Longispora fulva]GIG57227.1 membrane protein [Longispora fulva]
MDLDAYVAEHRGQWQRLEHLTRRRRLTAEEADELIALYQRTTTHLSVVRSRAPDPVLLARLSQLVLASRAAITGSGRFRWAEVGRFFTVSFPVTVYRARAWWISVGAGFTALWLLLTAYVAGHPETQRALMSEDKMSQLVDHDFESYYSEHAAQDFAFKVWTNNAWIAAVCLAAGVLVVPVFYVLWTNLLNLAVVGGVMVSHDRGELYFGLLAPHGLLELTAVFVAAGVGLRIGWSWIAPGPGLTRSRSLAQTARAGMTVAMGLVVVLLVSAGVEAFVTPSGLPTVARIAIGATIWLSFLGYVFALGSRAAARGETGDVSGDAREEYAPST